MSILLDATFSNFKVEARGNEIEEGPKAGINHTFLKIYNMGIYNSLL
jgi:hypothetical protein